MDLRQLIARLERAIARRLAGSDSFRQVILATVREHHFVFGDLGRVEIAATAVLNDALLNVSSGRITIGDYAFFGHGVSLLTGTHDTSQFGLDRQTAIPVEGRDIEIGHGVWISSNATVLGPCRVGDHAVVAAGSLVRTDVPPYTIVAGVPAQQVGEITSP